MKININVSTIDTRYDFEISSASYIGRPVGGSVMYVSKKVENLISNLSDVSHCLIFAEDTICIPDALQKSNCFVLSPNPQLDYALFVEKLSTAIDTYNASRKTTLTAGGYYVGENVTIGENAYIEPLCYIGHDVIIGRNARIYGGARIKKARIGDGFIAGENCTIGTTGFTMAINSEGNHMRIPTLGGIVIGNNVEIGALTNISCGSGGDTVIEDYTKIDSLVHIGHDAHLSRNVEIPAGAIVGGFDELGENTFVGINATLRNRIKTGDNAIIGMGAVVTKNVDNDTTVVGNPAKPFEKKV